MRGIFNGLIALFLAASAVADTLKVDQQRSRIQVDGKATGHGFTGTLKDYTIAVTGDPVNLKPKSLELSWKFSDLKTQEAKRDKEMIDWLGGGGPKGSFKFTKTWEKDGKNYAQGKITFHGVSKLIAFPYSVSRKGKWVTINGTATLNYRDFGLPIIRAMAVMKVDPELSVRFHIVGRL